MRRPVKYNEYVTPLKIITAIENRFFFFWSSFILALLRTNRAENEQFFVCMYVELGKYQHKHKKHSRSWTEKNRSHISATKHLRHIHHLRFPIVSYECSNAENLIEVVRHFGSREEKKNYQYREPHIHFRKLQQDDRRLLWEHHTKRNSLNTKRTRKKG